MNLQKLRLCLSASRFLIFMYRARTACLILHAPSQFARLNRHWILGYVILRNINALHACTVVIDTGVQYRNVKYTIAITGLKITYAHISSRCVLYNTD